MLKRTRIAAVLASTMCTVAVALPNVAQAAARSEALPSKSEWLADVAPVASDLRDYLGHRLAGVPAGQKPAIVLDIDNTSLATHYDPGRPVQAILDAVRYGQQHGAAVLFASYRDADSHDSTVRELTSAGYTVDGLCLKPADGSPGKAEVKLGCRKKYEGEGYTLIADVGNRSTDFEGGHYEKGFKLPDYDGALS
ncbi:HAD family acid phosphatase [Streptomyces gilvosporeus]|uniref:Acid phosphatase n=1 Tax=Streptomyces gilvosporeus TaxID=553510 RepID=A0A1V0U0S1_9ACTN|nr:HAD family acid phosphatase [Streptomyces gilvosporeus]ARF58783.1 acid phosphatase [Streptomyces gilvosporeus]